MIGDVYRLTEIGESDVQSLIDCSVVVEQTEVVGEIAREQDKPDAEENRGYDSTAHERV